MNTPAPVAGSRQTTHSEGCWRDSGHHACAVAMIERMQAAPVAAYREVTLDELTPLVKEAMQDGWNDICMDSGFHPEDIKQCGRRKLEFRASHWASNTASFLMRYLKREGIGAVIRTDGQRAQPE